MAKADAKLRALFARLDALYAQVPRVECKGLCAVTCGPVPLSHLEARRIQLATHKKPRTDDQLTCVYLTPEQRCSAYAIRPLICRAWGVIKSLSCMHGCVPERWWGTVEFVRLAQQIEKIGGGLVRTGPDGLSDAKDDSFTKYSEDALARLNPAHEERVRNLRALHGGRIVAITGDDRAVVPTFTSVDED